MCQNKPAESYIIWNRLSPILGSCNSSMQITTERTLRAFSSYKLSYGATNGYHESQYELSEIYAFVTFDGRSPRL